MRLWASLFLLLPMAVRADELPAKITELIDRPEYKQARWGILFVDAKTGRTVYERDQERLYTPASTTKLYSCAAALGELGADYRFKTPVHQRGVLKDGTLKGDLILVASGDLTFGGRRGKDGAVQFTSGDHTYANSGLSETKLTDSDPLAGIDDLAAQVAKAGIRTVTGEILIDDRLFEHARGSGSGPDLLTPIMVNDNVLDIVVMPGEKPGAPAKITVRPDTRYFPIDAVVTTAAEGKLPQLTLLETGGNTLTIRGEVACKSQPMIRVYQVGDPALFARALFIESLRRHGVEVTASLFQPGSADLPAKAEYAKLPKVAEHVSAPLADALKVTLKVSHNLYASTLPLLVATKHNERTLTQGLQRQGTFLKGLGVLVETISFAGGAGGMQADMITPAATVKLIGEMAKRSDASAYFDALPIIGVDGTLATVVPEDSPVKGKVQAKTGTLVFYDAMNSRMLLKSKALAGRMTTKTGTELYFAVFLNDMPLATGDTAGNQGKAIGKLCEIMHQYGP